MLFVSKMGCRKYGVIHRIVDILEPLQEYYPEIYEWFDTKVIHEVTHRTGKREIIILGKANQIDAFAIVKNQDGEKKICTIMKCHDSSASHLEMSDLFEECFRWLECDKPLFTVSDELRDKYLPFIELYDFEFKQLYEKSNSKYEFVYNGSILSPGIYVAGDEDKYGPRPNGL